MGATLPLQPEHKVCDCCCCVPVVQPSAERGTGAAVSHSCLHGDILQISALAWPVNVYLCLIYWVCKNAYHSELTAEGTQACPAACKVLCNAKCKENWARGIHRHFFHLLMPRSQAIKAEKRPLGSGEHGGVGAEQQQGESGRLPGLRPAVSKMSRKLI